MILRFVSLTFLTTAIGSMLSCGITPGWLTQKKFARKYAKEFCDREFDCDATGAAARWIDEDRCNDDYRDALNDAYGSKCKYRKSEARECLDSFRELPCDPLEPETDLHLVQCMEVWDCGDEIATEATP